MPRHRTPGPAARREPFALGAGAVGQPKNGTLDAPGATEGRTTTTDTPPALLALSEREFQRIVRGGLESRGFTCWVVPNMKLTAAGLPDILAWHERLPGLLLALELKRERDARVTPKQRAALAHLGTVPGVDARIVRPSEWSRLRDTLDASLGIAPRRPERDAGEDGSDDDG